jgi:CcmD family protein
MNEINPNLVVAGVTFIIWAGIFFYLLRLESKIKDLNR